MSAEHVRVVDPERAAAIDASQTISLRIQKALLEQLNEIADYRGMAACR